MQIFSKNVYFAKSTERISVNYFNADTNLLIADAMLVKVLLWLRFRQIVNRDSGNLVHLSSLIGKNKI